MTVKEFDILEKKKQNRYIIALVFLGACILLTAWLYIYILSLESKITTLDSWLQELQVSISQRESDPLIQSYILYERNKSIFSQLEYVSDIPNHVAHLKLTMLRYWITAQWFSYNDGNMQTKITSDNDTRWFWYEKVGNFVRSYRNDSQSPFHLAFITTFAWHDRIQHELLFELKEWSRSVILDDVWENPSQEIWVNITDEVAWVNRSDALEQVISSDIINSSWSDTSLQQ